MTSKIQDQSFHLAWNSRGTVTLIRSEAWTLLLAVCGAAPVQLHWHQAHCKDVTLGPCKQGTSWCVKKSMSSLPDLQDMMKQRASQPSQRYIPGCQKQRLMETNNLDGCWGTWGDVLRQVTGPMPGPMELQQENTVVWPEDVATEATSATSVLQLGSNPGCGLMGCWPMSHAGIWWCMHFSSVLWPWETCPPPDIWLKSALRISNYFWSQIQTFY